MMREGSKKLIGGARSDPRGVNTVNKKALTVLTIAAMLISILLAGSSFFIPSGDAPSQVSMSLYDADGVKMVSTGETAEYKIRVENTGSTIGHIDLSREGEADGWETAISHETLHLQPGDDQLVSLYVTPVDEDADPSIDVNVLASRGENITIVSTTTYVSTNVEILKDGDSQWHLFDQDSDTLEEGDELRSGPDSYAQFTFPGEHTIVLLPNSRIYLSQAHTIDGAAIFHYEMIQGLASFQVNLGNVNSTFTVEMDSGAMAKVRPGQLAVFKASTTGYVSVLQSIVSYRGSQTRQGDFEGFTNITAGSDSDGQTLDYAIITLDNNFVAGIIKNIQGESVGFNNEGEFVSNGDMNGFVLKNTGVDTFYIFDNDIEQLTLDLATLKPGSFDLTFTRYEPDSKGFAELKGFAFRDLTTPSGGTATLTFAKDRVTITSTSELTYNFEVHFQETKRFHLTDMTLYENEGNTFTVENYEHINNDEVNTVRFGRDKDGDGTSDDELMIRTGLTGDEVYDDLSEDEENSFFTFVLIALVLVLVIAAMYVLVSMGPPESLGPEDEPASELEDGQQFLRDLEQSMDEEERQGEEEAPDLKGPETDPESLSESESHPAPQDSSFQGPDDMEEPSTEPTSSSAEDLVEHNRDRILDEEFETVDEPEPAGIPFAAGPTPDGGPFPIPTSLPDEAQEAERAEEPDEPEEPQERPGPELQDDFDGEPESQGDGQDSYAEEMPPDDYQPYEDELTTPDEPQEEFTPPEPDQTMEDEFKPPEPDQAMEDEFKPPEPDQAMEEEFKPPEPDHAMGEDLFDDAPTDESEFAPIPEPIEESMVPPMDGMDDSLPDPGDEPEAPETDDSIDEPEIEGADGTPVDDEFDDGLDLDLDLFPEEEPIVPPQVKRRAFSRKDPEPSEDEDGELRYSLDEIRTELQKVRELKYEMDNLEGTSKDAPWWSDWNEKVKKDIDSLSKDSD